MLRKRGKLNAHLSGKESEKFCQLEKSERRMLDNAMQKLGLSARGYFKVLKVARTLADLSGEEKPGAPHLAEALAFRRTKSVT